MNKKILLISGPSGVGKSFLQDKLATKNYQKLIPSTTRNPRIGEVDGVDYNFLLPENYQRLKNQKLFLTDYLIGGQHYCFRKDFLSQIVKTPIIVIATQTILDFVQIFSNFELIYLFPKNMEILQRNMQKRGDSESEIIKRLKMAENELIIWVGIKNKIKNTKIIENDYNLLEFIQNLELETRTGNKEFREKFFRPIFKIH